jgi:hypothetical protein
MEKLRFLELGKAVLKHMYGKMEMENGRKLEMWYSQDQLLAVKHMMEIGCLKQENMIIYLI